MKRTIYTSKQLDAFFNEYDLKVSRALNVMYSILTDKQKEDIIRKTKEKTE